MAGLEDKDGQKREEQDLFFNLVPDMLCIASSEDGYFKELNPAWEKTLGFTRDELLSKPLLEFIHPDDRALTMSEIEKQLEGQSTAYFENRYICKDGSYKWLAWGATPAKGNLLYATARDITDHKKTEEAIKESEEKYRTLFERESDAIFIYDPDTTNILDANKATSKMYGYDQDELIGMSCLNLSAEVEESASAIDKIHEDDEVGVPYRLHRKKDGTVFPVDISGYAITLGGKKVMYAVSKDITQRKQTEDELLRHREHLEELVRERTHELQTSYETIEKESKERRQAEEEVKNMALFAELNPAPVLRFDKSGNVLMANPAAVDILDLESSGGMSLKSVITGIEKIDLAACINSGAIMSHSTQIGTRHFYFILTEVTFHYS